MAAYNRYWQRAGRRGWRGSRQRREAQTLSTSCAHEPTRFHKERSAPGGRAESARLSDVGRLETRRPSDSTWRGASHINQPCTKVGGVLFRERGRRASPMKFAFRVPFACSVVVSNQVSVRAWITSERRIPPFLPPPSAPTPGRDNVGAQAIAYPDRRSPTDRREENAEPLCRKGSDGQLAECIRCLALHCVCAFLHVPSPS